MKNPLKEIIDAIVELLGILKVIPIELLYAVGMLVVAAAMLGFVSVVALVWVYLERKISGHIQSRLGPMRVGPHGILQTLADGVKLMLKEDLVPAIAHRPLFALAPLLVFAGAFLPFVALPFSEHLIAGKINAGLFYVLSFAALEVIGIMMAGWASGSKWSLYGGMRLAAQMVSYEIPLGLSALCVVMFTSSLDMVEIGKHQGPFPWQWFASPFRSPFTSAAFLIFFISALAQTKRLPFDLPEAESELVAGFHTEYSGMRFAYFFLAEYATMYVMCAVASVLFLGGWNGPLPNWIPFAGAVNVIGKTCALLFVMVWLRWTLPRVRIDQIMNLCYKYMIPIALLCLLGAGLQAAL